MTGEGSFLARGTDRGATIALKQHKIQQQFAPATVGRRWTARCTKTGRMVVGFSSNDFSNTLHHDEVGTRAGEG